MRAIDPRTTVDQSGLDDRMCDLRMNRRMMRTGSASTQFTFDVVEEREHSQSMSAVEEGPPVTGELGLVSARCVDQKQANFSGIMIQIVSRMLSASSLGIF